MFFHGIAGLLNEQRKLLNGWPDALLETMAQESRARAMWELRHRHLIAEGVEALYDSGIRSVLLKGTAIAYAHYPNPGLRFRGDTDLLISESNLEQSRDVLHRLGWSHAGHTLGPFGNMHYQQIWQFRDPVGLTHDIDLHWEVTNSRALQNVLGANRVLAEAVPLPAISAHARRAEPVTTLIHQAINRALHARSGYFSIDRFEHDPNRLLWANDIDLSVKEITFSQWQTFVERCIETGVASVCLDALSFAAAHLGTIIPQSIREQLLDFPLETSATRFITSASELEWALADLRASSSWPARVRYILARAFPSSAHLRAKYPALGRWPIAILAAKRLLAAAIRQLKRKAG